MNDDGFTFLEVIISLLLISMIGTSLWGGVYAATHGLDKSRSVAVANATLLRLEGRLRTLAGRVTPPYWASASPAEISETDALIPFLDRDPAKAARLTFSGDILTLDDGTAPEAFKAVKSARFSLAADESKRICGVKVEVELAGAAPATIIARFGGMPIQGSALP